MAIITVPDNIGGLGASSGGSGSSGSGIVVGGREYFIDTDTGSDNSSGLSYASAWATLANLNEVHTGRVHIRGTTDLGISVVTLENSSFIIFRDGTFTGRLNNLQIVNSFLCIGDVVFDPNSGLNLREIDAEQNSLVVIDVSCNFLPGPSQDMLRSGKNSKIVVSDTQTVEGAVQCYMQAFLGGEIYFRAGEDLLAINSPAALRILDATNAGKIFAGDRRLASGVTASQFDVSVINTATISTAENGRSISEYSSFQQTTGGKLEGWVEFPRFSVRESILSEVTSTGTGVVGSILPVDVTSGISTINPPADKEPGSSFSISDSRGNAGTNNITVDFVTAGDNFHGASANDVLATDNSFARYTYINTTIGWVREA